MRGVSPGGFRQSCVRSNGKTSGGIDRINYLGCSTPWPSHVFLFLNVTLRNTRHSTLMAKRAARIATANTYRFQDQFCAIELGRPRTCWMHYPTERPKFSQQYAPPRKPLVPAETISSLACCHVVPPSDDSTSVVLLSTAPVQSKCDLVASCALKVSSSGSTRGAELWPVELGGAKLTLPSALLCNPKPSPTLRARVRLTLDSCSTIFCCLRLGLSQV